MCSTAVTEQVFPSLLGRRGGTLPLPKEQGSTSSFHPWLLKITMCVCNAFSGSPSLSPHKIIALRKKRPQRQLRACNPNLSVSFSTRSRGHWVALAGVWFKASFLHLLRKGSCFFCFVLFLFFTFTQQTCIYRRMLGRPQVYQDLSKDRKDSQKRIPLRFPKWLRPLPAQGVLGPNRLKVWERISWVSAMIASFTVPRCPLMAIRLNQYSLYSISSSIYL